MADSKISALPASTTPLAGTEVLPIVQSSATKQVSVANLTAGRAISATQLTLTTGNVIVASGQGIDFAAAGGNVLTQYDEYTAPSAACTGAITTAVIWKATKVGNMVTLTLPTTVGAATASGFFAFGELLPAAFRPSATTVFPCAVRDNDVSQDNPGMILILSAGDIRVYRTLSASAWTANASATAAGLGQGSSFACSWTI